MNASDPVVAFEGALASLIGVPYASAVTFARLGLRYALRAIGLVPGDEVILSGMTCRVVVLALQSEGFKPVYADLMPGQLNMDAGAVAQRLTKRTRAIVFQHTFGVGTGLRDVAEVAEQAGIPVIEDCAHCLPPIDASVAPGRSGVVSLWSHNFRKPLPVGAGGCVATSDAGLAARIRAVRESGRRRSRVDEVGWRLTQMAHRYLLRPATYWMLWSLQRRLRGDHQLRTLQDAIADEVTTLPVQISSRQAAWGLDGLRTAGERVRHSCRLTMLYLEGLSGLQAIRLVSEAENFPLYYFPILTSRKKELLDAARRARHEVIAWPLTTTIYPIERTEELVQSDYLPGSCPLAEQTAGSLCGLPVDLPTDERRAGRLIEFLRRFDEAA